MRSSTSNLSCTRLTILFIVSVVEMTFFSAVLLGWPSLKIILEEEGIGSHLCLRRTANKIVNGSVGEDGSQMCVEQEKSLNLSHNIAMIATALYLVIAGWAIDRYGAKAVKIFSSVVFCASTGFFAFTSRETPYLLTPALVTVAIASTGFYLSIMKSTTLYRKWQPTVNSVFGCALASSAVLFLIFKVLYERGVSYQILCQIFVSLTLAVLLSSIIIFPDIQDADLKDPTPPKTKPQPEKNIENKVKMFGDLRELIGHMTSFVFLSTCFFVGMCRLRLFFFVTTFQQFMNALPNMDKLTARAYADYYGITQLSSLALGPLVGSLITFAAEMSRRAGTQHRQVVTSISSKSSCQWKYDLEVEIDTIAEARACEVRGCTVYYTCSGFLLVMVSLFTVIPNAPLQIFSFVLVTLLRCFYIGGLSNLILVAFPVKYFGKLFAIAYLGGSLIQMLQLPTFNIMESHFPGEILKFNLGFLLVSIPLGVSYPCYLWYFAKRLEAKARTIKPTPNESNGAVDRLLYERVTVV